MRIQAVALIVLLSTGASGARAGEIRGVVRCPENSVSADAPVVVWVEGLPKKPVPEAHLVLSQREVRFSPTFLVVQVGQTVDMPNDDDVTHNVFSASATKAFNLGLYPKGDVRSVTFERAGLVELFCKIHRHMNAKIFVVPSYKYVVVNGSGTFSLAGLPAGTFKIRSWHDDLSPQEQTITVPAKGFTTVNFTLTRPRDEMVTQ